MAVLEGGVSASLAEVGAQPGIAAHATLKPLPHNWQDFIMGHYRVSHRVTLINAMLANAPIFELANYGQNLIVLTRLTLRAQQSAAGTAQTNALDVIQIPSFTTFDFTNISTPTASVKRVTMDPLDNHGAEARAWTGVGTGGMTGGTFGVNDVRLLGALEYRVAAAINTTTTWGPKDIVDDVNGTHPLIFQTHEAFMIRNRTLNVTSYGITAYIDCSWAEIPHF